jgi:hypothetical protein
MLGGFISVEKDRAHALVRLDEQSLRTLVRAIIEEIWKMKKHLIGVRVDLAAVSPTQLKEVVRMAWRHMAPREIAADHERNR